jgi:F-type H+-transporting ATPase subunit epsilon
MHLRVVVPTGSEVDTTVRYVSAEGEHGAFGVYPHHVDFAAALVPGIVTFTPEDGGSAAEPEVLAVDRGTLVKRGDEVSVAVWRAVRGPLEDLERVVSEEMLEVSEHEARARDALERIQADFVRRYVDLERER